MGEKNDRTLDKRLPEDAYLADYRDGMSIYFSPLKKILYILTDSGRGFVRLGGQDLWTLLEIFEAVGSYALPPGSRPKAILLAEDDIGVQRLLKEEIQETFGNWVQIIGFLNGKPAYDFFRNQADDVDLVISCINMPKVDGIQLLKACKSYRPDIPYIIYTALDYREEFSVWDADVYIVKDPDLTEILSQIRRLLNLERV